MLRSAITQNESFQLHLHDTGYWIHLIGLNSKPLIFIRELNKSMNLASLFQKLFSTHTFLNRILTSSSSSPVVLFISSLNMMDHSIPSRKYRIIVSRRLSYPTFRWYRFNHEKRYLGFVLCYVLFITIIESTSLKDEMASCGRPNFTRFVLTRSSEEPPPA